jgi:hypothetical protein
MNCAGRRADRRFWWMGRWYTRRRTRRAARWGFVAWLDNQYMVVEINGRMRWGTLSTAETQWLELAELEIVNGRS